MSRSRPGLKYNSITQRWEVVGKGGQIIASFKDNGLTKLTAVEVGATAKKVTKIYNFVATLTGNTTIGSGLNVTAGTLASSTASGISCAEIAVGDIVFGNPKIALTSAVPAGFYIPTTATLVVNLMTRDQSQGSLAAGAGFDIVSIRTTTA